MDKWLIIGGGIHGTCSAIALLEEGVAAADIAILDPHHHLLARWQQQTQRTGMSYLRSPGVHHLHPDPLHLHRFALQRPQPAGTHHQNFMLPHYRPSLELFQAHCEALIHEYQLDQRLISARAQGLSRPSPSQFTVETSLGLLHARYLILAMGVGEQLYWPDWAKPFKKRDSPIQHLYDPNPLPTLQEERLVIVGGGLSAVQFAITASRQSSRPVMLLMRHPLRIHAFDSDPGWLGPKKLNNFQQIPDFALRRRLIDKARHRGSVPLDVAQQLWRALREKRIQLIHDQITGVTIHRNQSLQLHLDKQADPLLADRVVLATGFGRQRPGGKWLEKAVAELGLPVHTDNYPFVDACLRWTEGIFVTGPLAELELGPAARNIAGARMAAARISASPEAKDASKRTALSSPGALLPPAS
ncbi:FAD/NAD(P)-binding protein [Nitrosococcus oceani]|uniref:FAD/NAD(P)-binding protein n=1 Tax=Nitrosococcus oceani TaxID=1229 RepID=UPI00068A52F5|nr:FAD/NAD(P)-binding protein [Nitrosococcus oceani]